MRDKAGDEVTTGKTEGDCADARIGRSELPAGAVAGFRASDLYELALSANGELLAYRDALCLQGVASELSWGGSGFGFAFVKGGAGFVYVGRDAVHFVDATSGQETASLPAEDFEHVAASSDGKHVAIGGPYGLLIADAAGKKLAEAGPREDADFGPLAFAPDGSEVVVLGGESIFVVNARKGSVTKRIPYAEELEEGLERAVASNGALVAEYVYDGYASAEPGTPNTEAPIQVFSVRDKSRFQLMVTADQQDVRSMAVSADGKLLVTGGQPDGASQAAELLIWDLADKRILRRLGAHPPGGDEPVAIIAVTMSGDGRRVASGDDAGRVYVWALDK